jgi:uncharacterized protein with PIN domain
MAELKAHARKVWSCPNCYRDYYEGLSYEYLNKSCEECGTTETRPIAGASLETDLR